jgi:hypothetical protein
MVHSVDGEGGVDIPLLKTLSVDLLCGLQKSACGGKLSSKSEDKV